LVFVRRSGEERSPGVHLGHDAARGPDIDACVISPTAEQDVRGAVPQSDDLIREGVDGDAERTRETKVGQLQLSPVVDEEVLRLQIAVEDAGVVAECYSLHQLVHERLDGDGIQSAPVAPRVHVPLQVLIHELEHQHQLVLRVDDVVQQDDVLVAELLHKGDLADGRGGRAFLGVEVDLLEGYELACLAVAALEHLQRSGHDIDVYGVGLPTVAYVPSPSFSSCWKELGCLRESMVGTMGAVWPSPRLRTLMEESVRRGATRVPACTGLRLPGGGREVNWGSQRMAEAVVSWRAMRSGEDERASSGGGAGDAVLEMCGVKWGRFRN
jgi:hypothetical protein